MPQAYIKIRVSKVPESDLNFISTRYIYWSSWIRSADIIDHSDHFLTEQPGVIFYHLMRLWDFRERTQRIYVCIRAIFTCVSVGMVVQDSLDVSSESPWFFSRSFVISHRAVQTFRGDIVLTPRKWPWYMRTSSGTQTPFCIMGYYSMIIFSCFHYLPTLN